MTWISMRLVTGIPSLYLINYSG